MKVRHDAIGMNQCGSCRFFHNPMGGEIGACIINPPQAFIVGVAPTSPLVDPTKPGAQMAHVIKGYFPLVSVVDGCGKHENATAHERAN